MQAIVAGALVKIKSELRDEAFWRLMMFSGIIGGTTNHGTLLGSYKTGKNRSIKNEMF